MKDPAEGAASADDISDINSRPLESTELGGGWPVAILLVMTFFVVIAPTLSWLEFAASMENLVAATSLEIRRTGQWLQPTLESEPRVMKPPLAAWVSAATIRSSTFARLDSADSTARRDAYRALAWEIRWPALAASCLTLLAVFDLGKTVGGIRTGLYAAAIAGSSAYIFRYGRQATTDVHLALWATVTIAALARICLRGVTWKAALVAGIAAGLALMSKGPVVLLQSVMPAILFVIVRGPDRRNWKLAPLFTATAAMLVIGATWYVWVLLRLPDTLQRWETEVVGAGRGEHSGNLFSYGPILIYMMLPWSPIFVHALIWTGVDAVAVARKRAAWTGHDGWILMLLTIGLPVLVMSFFPVHEERYMLPLLGPFAVLTARSLAVTLEGTGTPKIPGWVQWVILLVIGLGLPVMGMTSALTRVDGQPMYSKEFAIAALLLMALVMVGAIALARRRPVVLLGATVVVMLIVHVIFYFGYRDMRQCRSAMRPLAEAVRRRYPDALVYNWRPDSNKRASVDFSIYLNRSTVWTSDPTKLPRTIQPQVYIRLQNKGEPEPSAAPGWTYFAQVRRDKDAYLSFGREGVIAPAAPEK